MTGFSSLQAVSIGPIAEAVLTDTRQGVVMGCSSQGIFIRAGKETSEPFSGPNPIIFLSNERFRGPLTVNFQGIAPAPERVSPGMEVTISSEMAAIPDAGIEFSMAGCPVWQVPSRPAHLPKPQRSRILDQFVSSIPDWESIQSDWCVTLEGADQLLGKGEGLTPFGDDVLIGLLLALNRWGDVLRPETDVEQFNCEIAAAAHEKTTTLSASLIECAARGQADERLIRTIDHLMGDNPHPDKICDNLLQWGHSSGLGTLIGMAIAIRHHA